MIDRWTRQLPRDKAVRALCEHRIPVTPVRDLADVIDVQRHCKARDRNGM
jgi:crotonobetainyl-CoA:carnitine CoA-transferase CaiB-like acyl-CoA transferase